MSVNIKETFAYLDILAKSSLCKRKGTAAIIFNNNSMIHDYNKIYSGDYGICQDCPREREKSGYWTGSKCPIAHAEVTVINRANSTFFDTNGGIMVCTYKPCLQCSEAIVKAGIKEVIYRDEYEGGSEVTEYLKKAGVKVRRYSE